MSFTLRGEINDDARQNGIELWRTRRSTVTKQDLAEYVLILRRP